MAFTDTQKAQIRFYLGYQERFIWRLPLLETQLMDGVLSSDTEGIAISILSDLATIDTGLVDARSRLKAKKVEDIDLPGFDEIESLRDEGRRMVNRLAAIFGVDVNWDVYGESSVSMGGMIRLG